VLTPKKPLFFPAKNFNTTHTQKQKNFEKKKNQNKTIMGLDLG
jgi:predicted small lipoprotein YifL